MTLFEYDKHSWYCIQHSSDDTKGNIFPQHIFVLPQQFAPPHNRKCVKMSQICWHKNDKFLCTLRTMFTFFPPLFFSRPPQILMLVLVYRWMQKLCHGNITVNNCKVKKQFRLLQEVLKETRMIVQHTASLCVTNEMCKNKMNHYSVSVLFCNLNIYIVALSGKLIFLHRLTI